MVHMVQFLLISIRVIYDFLFISAVLGYEMDMKAFVDTHIVKNTEVTVTNLIVSSSPLKSHLQNHPPFFKIIIEQLTVS